ncbi:MAG: hypothetical protein LBH52_02705 [Puniceicoccales bacterium]|jgi:uncharacterized repeat protein (TIGR04138 family)|nr:hypothetical protein [Puniceicoccales bacterium]
MQEVQERLLTVVDQIKEKYPLYGRRAYLFVYEVVGFTGKKLQLSDKQHITAENFLKGFRDLAKESFGPMAMDVLKSWNVQNCEDVGRIVSHFVEFSVLRKESSDSFDDFTRYQFDFNQAF